MDDIKKGLQQPYKTAWLSAKERSDLLNSLTIAVAEVKTLAIVMARSKVSQRAIDAFHGVSADFMEIAMTALNLSQDEVDTMFAESDILADTKIEAFIDFLKRSQQ